jgi:hypothetical protein
MTDPSATPPPEALPDLPIFGVSGTMPGVRLDDAVSLRDLMDEGEPLDSLR